MDKFTVVSLCDGISIGRLALEQLGYDGRFIFFDFGTHQIMRMLARRTSQ